MSSRNYVETRSAMDASARHTARPQHLGCGPCPAACRFDCPDLNRPQAGGLLQQHVAAAVLNDEPDDAPLIVVGHSLGGQVAMEMALLAPHRIRRLILVCTRDIPVPEFHAAARALRAGAALDVEATIARWFTTAEIADGARWSRVSAAA